MKGAADVAIDKTAVSTDGKTIIIATTANLVNGTYTVKVDDLSKDFEGSTSKVDKIEILSTKAAVKRLPGDGTTKYSGATVGYQVLNQFGDDITKNVSLNVNSSVTATLSPSSHLINFSTNNANGFMLGRDIITVVLLDTTGTGVSTSATLELSAEAYAADIKFDGVYNVDGKELTEDIDFNNDPFYMLFTANDQYGNKFNEYKNIDDNDELFVTVIGGLTALDKGTNGGSFIVINKDGVDYLAYPLKWNPSMDPAAGTASVQVLSAGGGSCTGEIAIGEGGRVVSLTVSQNGVVVAGEENEISYTALDASGKEVTSFARLRASEITITGGSGNYDLAFQRKEDGSAKLVLDARNEDVAKNNTTMLSYSFKTKNNKFSTALIQVSENARPVAIDGLRDVDLSASSQTTYVPVKVKNLVIEDQYGRILPDWQVASMMGAGETGAYKISTLSAIVDKTTVIAVTKGGVTANPGTEVNVNVTGKAKGDELFRIIPQNKGTEVLKLQIENAATQQVDKLADASVNLNFNVKDTTAATTSTATVDPVYVVSGGSYALANYAPNYKQHVKVKANGSLLSRNDYTVEAPYGMAVTYGAIDGTNVWDVYSNIGQDSIKEFKDETATTLTRTLTITLNGSGEKFTVDVTIDRTAPKITTVADLASSITPVSGTAVSAGSLFSVGGAYTVTTAGVTWIADQYGKQVTDNADGTFTFQNGTNRTVTYTFVCTVPYGKGVANGAPLALSDNNTEKASMTVQNGFAGATLTIDFGGVKKDIKVKAIN